MCKDNKQYSQKIADILAQLLQAEDASELILVNNSLITLLKIDPKGCLAGLFNQVRQFYLTLWNCTSADINLINILKFITDSRW